MKTSFVLQNRYEPMVVKLSDKQAGILFKALFVYVATKKKPEYLTDNATAMAFDFICQDLDYNAARYEQVCALRAQAGRKGGQAKKSKTSNCLPTTNSPLPSKSKHNDTDVVVDVDVEVEVEDENINTLTAPPPAAQRACVVSLPKPQTQPPTAFIQFAAAVAKRFEPGITNPTQQDIWFKRNARCLKDIWAFCTHDTTLALQTIEVCAQRLAKAGMTGGYEAVCRNLPEYCEKAREQLHARMS